MEHLQNNNMLSEAQNGSRRERSCESKVILVINEVAKSLDDGVILLDVRKAIDKVSLNKLVNKLNQNGLREQLYGWIKSFLSDPTQAVILEGVKSEKTKVWIP